VSEAYDKLAIAEAECKALCDRLSELDPSKRYTLLRRRDLGLPEPASAITADAGTLRQETAEHLFAWKQYLLGRYHEQTARHERRARSAEAQRRGLGRFIGEGASLDEITAETLSDPESFRELHEANFERRKAEQA
jgi:hypothetical protein